MYIGHGRLCVCLSLSAFPHYCTDPDITWGNGRECPRVVHYWAYLQSVHGFRCYNNTHVCKLIALYTVNAYSTECKMLASACTRSMPDNLLCQSYLRLRQTSEGLSKWNLWAWLMCVFLQAGCLSQHSSSMSN